MALASQKDIEFVSISLTLPSVNKSSTTVY